MENLQWFSFQERHLSLHLEHNYQQFKLSCYQRRSCYQSSSSCCLLHRAGNGRCLLFLRLCKRFWYEKDAWAFHTDVRIMELYSWRDSQYACVQTTG